MTQHHKVFGKIVNVNRFTSKWGIQDAVQDLGQERVRDLIDYYFKTTRLKHDIEGFLRIYDQLNVMFVSKEEDEKKRAELREKTRLKVQEWEATHGAGGSGTN
jgi:hypothetical protein